MGSNFTVAVCVPSLGQWQAQMGACLAGLYAHLARHPVPGYLETRSMLLVTSFSNLPHARQTLLEMAITRGASHALFIDSDMTFPLDVVHSLACHRRAVVAANCSVKSLPPTSTALTRGPAGLVPLAPPLNASGLIEVESAGTAVMLIDLAIVQQLEKPWFQFTYADGRFGGEDAYFCQKVRAAGHPIYVDPAPAIGHVGEFVYKLD